MLSFLPAPLVGVIAGFLFFISILVMGFLVVLVWALSFLVPFKAGREYLIKVQNDVIPSAWIDINTFLLKLATRIEWDIQGKGTLNFQHWYFVFANHQTWADIVVMQKVFNRKIPLLKFFLKQELLWSLPMGGLACWTLDYPFMKRHSKAYLKKYPEKRNSDLEATKTACEKFKERPTAVMNFLEGTRFTKQKQKERSSPYKNLLRPKAGGVAFVVSELREYIKEVIDVTLIYCDEDPSFWNFLKGKVPKVIVKYEVIPLTEDLYGDYYNDSQFRKHFQSWINGLWQKKDALIEETCARERIENSK